MKTKLTDTDKTALLMVSLVILLSIAYIILSGISDL